MTTNRKTSLQAAHVSIICSFYFIIISLNEVQSVGQHQYHIYSVYKLLIDWLIDWLMSLFKTCKKTEKIKKLKLKTDEQEARKSANTEKSQFTYVKRSKKNYKLLESYPFCH